MEHLHQPIIVIFFHIFFASTPVQSWVINSAQAYQRLHLILPMVPEPELQLRQPVQVVRTEVEKTLIGRKPCKSDCSCNYDEDEHSHHHNEGISSPQEFNPEVVDMNMLKVTTPSHLVTNNQSKLGGEQVLFVNQSADLYKIQDKEVQLVVWRQKSAPEFVTILSDPSIAPEDLPAFTGMVLAEKGHVAQKMKMHLWGLCNSQSPEMDSRVLNEKNIDQLVDYVDNLVQVFANIARDAGFLGEGEEESPYVNVKLKVFDNNGCAYWHQDAVPFRMVSTFRGPCTEWVPPAFTKETLEQRKVDSKHAQSLSHCDVALFKGRGQILDGDMLDSDKPGIVHRSPRIEGSGVCRLVLVLDIPQQGWHF